MRILLVSDAWAPQVNGVVRTLSALRRELEGLGHAVILITPDRFRTIPCPTYPEIRLVLPPYGRVGQMIEQARPDAIHIATEGPLGLAARAFCRRRGLAFTSSFHTKFAEYLEVRFGFPARFTWGLLRRFHGRAARTMVATQSLQAELTRRGFARLAYWPRGVDLDLFKDRLVNDRSDPPPADPLLDALPRPIFLNVGRIAVEKNLPAFLALDLPGSKVVVGDGPLRAGLQKRYPDSHFLGLREGAGLARCYAAADVFVFPSRTDTFGLVLLEALASGLPVAAFPVTGPVDVIGNEAGRRVGRLDEDLGRAALQALDLDRQACRAFAEQHGWGLSARRFMDNLEPVRLAG